ERRTRGRARFGLVGSSPVIGGGCHQGPPFASRLPMPPGGFALDLSQSARCAAGWRITDAWRRRKEWSMATTMDDLLPTAKDLQKKLALAEAEKAAASARKLAAEEAEKKALLDHFAKPSGVSDEERMKRAAAIIQRAVNNGLTEVFVGRFPNRLCTDHGRAINQAEAGWEKTRTGLPKELYDFWDKQLRARGYKLRVQIVDFPGGMPGDVGFTLSWH